MSSSDYDLDLLLKQLQKLKDHGFDMSQELDLYHIGDWSNAFGGVYYEHVRNPGLLEQSDIDFLTPIFGERLSDLEPKDQI